MQITNVRIRLLQNAESKLRAIASITIDDCFVIHDIKIFTKDEGYYVAMPSRRASEGEYKDIAHPINNETRSMISQIILAAYHKELSAS